MPSTTILIADDSRTIRTQVRRILEDEGFRTVEASSGIEALERIRECCPSAAILDINMPELDGYGVCIELSRDGRPVEPAPHRVSDVCPIAGSSDARRRTGSVPLQAGRAATVARRTQFSASTVHAEHATVDLTNRFGSTTDRVHEVFSPQ